MKVKEFVDDSAGNVARNTVKVNKLIESLEESFLPKEHPFHEGNPEIRKSNILAQILIATLQKTTKPGTMLTKM